MSLCSGFNILFHREWCAACGAWCFKSAGEPQKRVNLNHLPMASLLFLPDPTQLAVGDIEVDEGTKTVTATVVTTAQEALCPLCQHPASRIHSRYVRTLADLPCAGRRVRWLIEVRRFWCKNEECPRTSQVNAVVGHHDSAAHPSHFLALNLNGQIEVIEFPGGDAAHALVYLVGAQLAGPHADLVPVTLQFVDTRHDQQPDMIVQVGGEQFVYRTVNGQFQPLATGRT